MSGRHTKPQDPVASPVEEAVKVFNTHFLSAWLTSPILSHENCDGSDDFGMFLAGGEI